MERVRIRDYIILFGSFILAIVCIVSGSINKFSGRLAIGNFLIILGFVLFIISIIWFYRVLTMKQRVSRRIEFQKKLEITQKICFQTGLSEEEVVTIIYEKIKQLGNVHSFDTAAREVAGDLGVDIYSSSKGYTSKIRFADLDKKITEYQINFKTDSSGILFSFSPSNYSLSSNLRDKIHAQLIQILLDSKIVNCFPKQEVEYYYQHYDNRGYIDLIAWDEEIPLIIILEVKTSITDIGGTIRQVNKYEKYLTQFVDPNFQDKGCDYEVYSFLVVPADSANFEILKKNYSYIKKSKIKEIIVLDIEMGLAYYFDKDSTKIKKQRLLDEF